MLLNLQLAGLPMPRSAELLRARLMQICLLQMYLLQARLFQVRLLLQPHCCLLHP